MTIVSESGDGLESTNKSHECSSVSEWKLSNGFELTYIVGPAAKCGRSRHMFGEKTASNKASTELVKLGTTFPKQSNSKSVYVDVDPLHNRGFAA